MDATRERLGSSTKVLPATYVVDISFGVILIICNMIPQRYSEHGCLHPTTSDLKLTYEARSSNLIGPFIFSTM